MQPSVCLNPFIIVMVMMMGDAGALLAQAYPNRPIRLVAPEPGSGVDITARLIAQGVSAGLGQNMIVDNRGNVKSGEIVSLAPPDGYTLLIQAGSLWITPLLQKMPYDPVKDFSPITIASTSPSILVVHPSLPVSSVKELIAYAKVKPGALNYASGTIGAGNHLAAELFSSMADIKLVRIPYKGAGPAINALVGGETQLMFAAAGAAIPHIKSGRLRALAVTSIEPSPLAPGLPTLSASGLPGYDYSGATAMLAPAKTPAVIINQLNREIVQFLKMADAKEKFLNSGGQAIGSTPEELAAARDAEMKRMGKVIKEAGISVQ